ncbi:MAG: pentapeptide repeat-containing protein [Candidatus Eremiobacteraeota bacterium]|nr:pentapeptide repeat-containing protein [Candidatus Eremiobacteraeota bacterium]
MMVTPVFGDVARVALAILLNSLWQGALIALVASGVLRIFVRANAATRYAIWAFALIAMVAIPVVTSVPRVSVEPAAAPARNLSTSTTVATHDAPRRTATHQMAPVPANPPISLPQFRVPRVHLSSTIALAAFGLWALAALVVLVRLIVAIVALERLKRDSLPLDVAYRDQMPEWNGALKEFRDVRLCVSDAIDVPVAIGLFDAMILLPTHLVHSLEPQEIDQIALHELGHLRRNDDWTNAVQRIACALLFFSPAAWFVSRQLDLEREVACDDYVLEATGAARSYAFCLTRIAEVTSWPRSGVAAAPGVFLTRRNISIRIERLLRTGRSIGSAIAPEIAATVVVALAAVLILVRTMTPSVAYTLPANQVAPATAPVVAKQQAKTQSATMATMHVAHKIVQQIVSVEPAKPAQKVEIIKVEPPQPAGIARKVAQAATPAPPLLGPIIADAVTKGITKGLSEAQVASNFDDTCSGCDYSHSNYSGHDFSKKNLTGADFDHTNLQGAKFDGARLTGANFDHADLTNASFRNANLIGCNLDHARLDGAHFEGARIVGCNFDAQALSRDQARIFLTQCSACNFEGVDLHGMDLRNIHVKGARMDSANLSGADLSGGSFTGVNFSGANFSGAKLRNARFRGCNLDGVDFDDADTNGASFEGSSRHRASGLP